MRIICCTGSDNNETRIGSATVAGAILGLLVIGAAVGGLGLKLWDGSHARLARDQARLERERDLLDRLDRQKQIVQDQQEQIAQTASYTRHRLDALGVRLGALQADVLRLNAFGRRLTRVAGLDGGEFDFSENPAVGGPAPLENAPAETRPDLLGAADLLAALDELSSQVDHNKAQMAALEALIIDRKIGAAQLPDVWPTGEGWVSSGYGYRIDPFTGTRDFHSGIDIAAPAGTPINAVASGVVTAVDREPAYGLKVEINHGNGYVTRYAHTEAVGVKVGDKVEKRQTVATVGSSGRSTGPHLHFEVVRDSRHINPRKYLQAASR